MTRKELDKRFAALASSVDATLKANRESALRQDAFAARMETFAARTDLLAERMDGMAARMDDMSDRIGRIEHDISSMKGMLEELLHRRPVAGFAAG
jgi:chromosome segregation ATPase